MELPESSRPLSLLIYFPTASFLLYIGLAICFVSPGGYHESALTQISRLALFIVPALLLTFRIAWIMRRPESPQLKGRGLRLTVPASLGIVVLGSILISLAIFREHWIEVFWNR
jgi:hypothetical protein